MTVNSMDSEDSFPAKAVTPKLALTRPTPGRSSTSRRERIFSARAPSEPVSHAGIRIHPGHSRLKDSRPMLLARTAKVKAISPVTRSP
jgi:hypothetical protein